MNYTMGRFGDIFWFWDSIRLGRRSKGRLKVGRQAETPTRFEVGVCGYRPVRGAFYSSGGRKYISRLFLVSLTHNPPSESAANPVGRLN